MTASNSIPTDLAVSRRWLLRGMGLGGLALLGGVSLLGGRDRTAARTATRGMMGSTATIVLHGASRAQEEAAVAAAFARMEAVAAAMTRYEAESDVGRVNARPGTWVPVGPETAVVVNAALAYARASEGAFDPALDRLTDLWGFHAARPAGDLPSAEGLEAWRGRTLYKAVEVGGTVERPSVRLADPAAGMDLGGIAKGYAVDAAVEELRQWGIRNALVEAGGDLYALGRDPNGKPWAVGVRHPRDAARLLTTLYLTDEAAATSGDDARFFEVNGLRYAHLMDPRRARPATYLHSLTVRAPRALAADALATAASVMPMAAGGPLLKRLGAHGWVAMQADGRMLEG